MNSDRLKFRARLGVSYYDDAGNDVDGMLVIDNVAVYHDGSVGFSEENLADAIDRLAKTDRENESIWQYVEDNFSTESDLWYWAPGAIVEQCTGISDKIGNLIYVGDIVKSPNNSYPLQVKQDTNGLWACIEYRPGGMRELPLYDLTRLYNVELIGNIHEQKEDV